MQTQFCLLLNRDALYNAPRTVHRQRSEYRPAPRPLAPWALAPPRLQGQSVAFYLQSVRFEAVENNSKPERKHSYVAAIFTQTPKSSPATVAPGEASSVLGNVSLAVVKSRLGFPRS